MKNTKEQVASGTDCRGPLHHADQLCWPVLGFCNATRSISSLGLPGRQTPRDPNPKTVRTLLQISVRCSANLRKNAVFGIIQKQRYLLSTGGGTRTHMRLLSPDFESGASANSATPASVRKRSIYGLFSITKGTWTIETDHFYSNITANFRSGDGRWLVDDEFFDYESGIFALVERLKA